MAGFTYRLYLENDLENGEDIGSFATAVSNWPNGDEFYSGGHTSASAA